MAIIDPPREAVDPPPGGPTQLKNDDLAPVPTGKRTWGAWSYTALWLGMVHNIFGFAVIGSLMGTGLTAVQALVSVLIACLMQVCLLVVTGRIGSRFGIPFPVWARSAFGIWGSNIPAILRGITAVFWFGIQNYLGASVLNALFSQVFAWWRDMSGEFMGLSSNMWLSILIFWSINFIVIHHGMETVRRFEVWAGPLVLVVMAVLVGWAIDAGNGLGPVFDTSDATHDTVPAFVAYGLIPAVATFMNSGFITMILNYPDLARFAKSNKSQTIGTLIGLPVGTFVYYAMSAIVVSGTQAKYGEALWDPGAVLTAIGIPWVTIVGAILLTIATISVNIPANLVSPAYDLVNLFPKVFTFKTAAVTAIVGAFLYCPWYWMRDAASFYDLLANLGTFLGPATGIMVADIVIRRGRLDVDELYQVHGRYRFFNGFNPVAVGVLVATTAGVLALKLIPSVSDLYLYSWFISVAVAFVAYAAIASWINRNTDGVLRRGMEPSGTKGEELAEGAIW
ncbi:cytosine permease [Gordonia sp. zg691]|uniref:Cytosine permease n=1 Tax=Gordonia jinghuaiqii TaxID=2758710 RepID=A0A7D7RC09_9ACTN|nr:cytosine permease [Gordonia jinghuaiqii]MBD0861928.1 cytosine permease [Gordonia jinghuaiqii]MCR5977833.1 allantoin permease [Gordonia jinghuaiqii]QMT02490.1 cytosine permease [Gordonia jinghuaiqii]